MRQLTRLREDAGTWLVGTGLIAAACVALVPGRPTLLAAALVAAAALAAGATLLPRAWARLRSVHSLVVVWMLAALVLAWIAVGIVDSAHTWDQTSFLRDGQPFPALGLYISPGPPSWPWRVGAVPLWPVLLAAVSAAGGFVLVADAVRVQIGVAGPSRSPWRALTRTPSRGGRTAVRAVPGVGLVVVAALLAVGIVNRLAPEHPIVGTLGGLVVEGGAALLVAAPVAVGLLLGLDLDFSRRAQDRERERFAAHLHDSVLQTLALIQRQAGDAESVSRLARRQEHALRSWMAGESELGRETVAFALRDAISEVEDEYGLDVELTQAGDATLDARGRELVAAAREALRNVARHAPGAPVNVFLDVGATSTELYVRDSGPGFDFAEVPAERRGLRDAVIGRMRAVGGSATVDSRLGDGTEVALILPRHGGRRR